MFATLQGLGATRAEVTIPMTGNWTADVWIAEASSFTGKVTLTIGDLVLVGTVTRGGTFTGASNYRLIGGAGGWMREVEPKPYRSPFGVKASQVLTAAARDVGETVVMEMDRTLGSFWSRERGPAARQIQMMGLPWYMREDGVTVFGTRATPTISSSFDVLKADLEKGRVQVATDFPSKWMPGAKFSSTTLPQQQISAVTHYVTSNKLRTEVWTVG